MSNTTTHQPFNCLACGEAIPVIGTRAASLVRHMINAGEISVGEAREELRHGMVLDAQSAEYLATFVLDRADQGDDWKAGDDVTLPNGEVVAYDDEGPARERLLGRSWIGSFVYEFPVGTYPNGL